MELSVAIHDFTSRKVILIYVHPHKDGFVIMKTDGQYQDPSGSQRTKFRKGDIYTRHGTSIEFISQTDLNSIFENGTRGFEPKREMRYLLPCQLAVTTLKQYHKSSNSLKF